MARVKGGLNAKKKHNRVLKLAKGYRGARSKQYRVAKQSVMRALTSSYAAALIRAIHSCLNCLFLSFLPAQELAEVDLNRKVLSDMAINDAEGFAKLAELAKSKLA